MPTNTPVRSNKPLGGLYAKTREQQLVFALKHTEVQAKISGNLSRVAVTQTFENPLTEPLEAIYVFPLPDEAAVDEMEIKIGDRIIKGTIKKREDAQAIYEKARQEGRTAGLLEQERDNIFTQSLANIKPGEVIDVTIRYTDSLKFVGGDYEFIFPMVVGPRFIPGIPIDGSGDTDSVPDASRITPSILPPATRSGHDIGITVEIDAGVPIGDIRSTSHRIRIEHDGPLVRVQLGEEDTIPNKDLILRYRVSSDRTSATVFTQSDERGGHFAIYLIPALDYTPDEIVPKDVVFLIDTSGSQQGDPLRKSQELMRQFIHGLNPDDTFTIIDFSDITTQLSPKPLANTLPNRTQAIHYINQLQANGGTYLLNGIRAVLNFPATSTERLRSIVLLTDGYIGNENEILAEVQQYLKPGNRLYSFGVGSSPNRFLLNRLAEIGRGTARIVRQDEPTEEVATQFFHQINNPVLTTIQVSWEGIGEAVIYPLTPPDLFTQQPLVLFGRISRINEDDQIITGTLHITGTAAGGQSYQQTFDLTFEDAGNPAIPQLWGRARIKDLMNQMFRYDKKTQVEAVTETALTYQLLSQYTAFVTVSEEVRVDPEGHCRSVEMPVEMPEGVSYEGIFGDPYLQRRYQTRLSYSPLRSSASVVKSVNCNQEYNYSTRSTAQHPKHPRPVILSDKISLEELATALAVPETEIIKILFFKGMAVNLSQALDQHTAMMVAKELGVVVQTPDDGLVSNELDLISPKDVLAPDRSLLQVVSATGLDTIALADLAQHLQQVHLPSGLRGEIVFELRVQKSRLVRVILDEDASTLEEVTVIDLIKRSLLRWRVPELISGTANVRLRIQSDQTSEPYP